MSEQEGDVMDLQRAYKTFRLSEGNDTRYNGRNAFRNSVLRHLQQHDGCVHSAHAEEKIVDCPFFKQITHEDGIDDRDRLEQYLFPGSGINRMKI